jgi:hypothetical protein
MAFIIIEENISFERAMLSKQYVYVWQGGLIVAEGIIDSYDDASVIIKEANYSRKKYLFTYVNEEEC